jgi:chemotaxis protein methyltransferase CheR
MSNASAASQAVTPGWPQLESRVAERLGMRCDDLLRTRLIEAVDLRMKRRALNSVNDYAAQLGQLDDGGRSEIEALAQHLTIGETYFFRGSDHFRVLAEAVLPELIRRNAATRRLRLLSAGCSSGEEPYSLAMLMQELIEERYPELGDWQIDIVGADLNEAALTKARRGIYTPWSLRDVPAAQVRRHFHPSDGRSFELNAALRAKVRFEPLNLMQHGAFWQQTPFDVLFCRNVLIYFTPQAMVSVLQRFEQLMSPGAYLFLGHSETLRGLTRAYRLCQSQDAFYYQLMDEAQQRAAAPVTPWELAWDAAADIATTPFEPLATITHDEAPNVSAETSWMDAIQRASDRIANLAGTPSAAPLHTNATAPRNETDRARALFREERYAEVTALLRDPLAAQPDIEALMLFGAALTNQGQIAEAEQVCRRVQALDEFNAEAAYLLALCREHAGDADGAVRQAQLAAYMDADFAMPHLLVGRLARRGGEYGKAQRELNRALGLIASQDSTRTLLFGGGFGREALSQLCRAELAACAGRA